MRGNAVELQHVHVELLTETTCDPHPEAFVGIFHEWIRAAEDDDLLLDVSDYLHLTRNARVLLITYHANLVLTDRDGRWALEYHRKTPLEGTNRDRLWQALRAVLQAARRLEAEPGSGLRFDRHAVQVSVNDRALAPNVETTWRQVRPLLGEFGAALFVSESVELEWNDDRRGTFSVRLASPVPLEDAAALESRPEADREGENMLHAQPKHP